MSWTEYTWQDPWRAIVPILLWSMTIGKTIDLQSIVPMAAGHSQHYSYLQF
jgi:hypothetical protein